MSVWTDSGRSSSRRVAISFIIWMTGFFSDKIIWRGPRYHVKSGQLVPIPSSSYGPAPQPEAFVSTMHSIRAVCEKSVTREQAGLVRRAQTSRRNLANSPEHALAGNSLNRGAETHTMCELRVQIGKFRIRRNLSSAGAYSIVSAAAQQAQTAV
jgi:hypothetical protein